jgi:uncharacterized protein (TIGR02996 family)
MAGHARHAAFEAAILADRDNVEEYLVYADWLIARGDPRGELIVAQYRSDDPMGGNAMLMRDEILAKHPELVPPLNRHRRTLRWRLGFLDRVKIEDTEPDDLDTLFGHPSAALLRTLSLDAAFPNMPAAIARLGESQRPTLETLEITRSGATAPTVAELEAMMRDERALDDRLFAQVPRLKTLTFRGSGAFNTCQHEGLTTLNLRNPAPFNCERWLLPTLTTLSSGWTSAIWESDLPSLRNLDLRSAPHDPFEHSGFRSLLPRLETLHVHLSWLDEDPFAACARLEGAADLIGHLQRLDVSYTLLENLNGGGEEARLIQRLDALKPSIGFQDRKVYYRHTPGAHISANNFPPRPPVPPRR